MNLIIFGKIYYYQIQKNLQYVKDYIINEEDEIYEYEDETLKQNNFNINKLELEKINKDIIDKKINTKNTKVDITASNDFEKHKNHQKEKEIKETNINNNNLNNKNNKFI